MQQRLIVALRQANEKGIFEFLRVRQEFFTPSQEQYLAFEKSGVFRYHPDFAEYMEKTQAPARLLTSDLTRDAVVQCVSSILGVSPAEVISEPFSQTARALGRGESRRSLQMAIQYLSNDGIDDSLVAGEYDWDFLQQVKADLKKN